MFARSRRAATNFSTISIRKPGARLSCSEALAAVASSRPEGAGHVRVLKQIELLRARPRRPEMRGGDLVLTRVEAELFASDFEAAADHPGDRAGAGLPLAESGIVILAAAHVADELEDMAVTVGEIRHQPFAEEIPHFERQPQQHVAGMAHPGRGDRF